jgi:exodeoxyribonuclease V alpha subunit
MSQTSVVKGTVSRIFAEKTNWLAGVFEPDSDSFIPDEVSSPLSDRSGYRFSGPHMYNNVNFKDKPVVLSGQWVKDKKYGWGFKCASVDIEVLDDLYFFLTTFVTGIGKKTSKRIVKSFSFEQFKNMVEKDPKSLLGIQGIGRATKDKIVSSWHKAIAYYNISALLVPHGCTSNFVRRICTHFKDVEDLESALKQNPYMMTQVAGVGFEVCDKIALSMGFQLDDAVRVQAAIMFHLQRMGQFDGDTVIGLDTLYERFDKDAKNKIDANVWDEHIRELNEQGRLVLLTQDRVCLKSHFNAAQGIEEFISDRINRSAPPAVQESRLDDFIKGLESKQGFKYNKDQRLGIELTNQNSLVIMSGIAGAGKTTCAKGMLNVLEQRYTDRNKIWVGALSGIATDRIKKETGYNGSTIQSLLVNHKEVDVFPYDVMIIDEAAMIPTSTLYSVMRKVGPSCRMVLIGDKCQLDPVGPGSPFSDILDCAKIPTVNLTEPNRTSAQSSIISVANDVRKGVFPRKLNERSNEFFYVKHNNGAPYGTPKEMRYELNERNYQGIANSVERYFRKAKVVLDKFRDEEDYMALLYRYQLLAPIKKGTIGTIGLNRLIQGCLNPDNKPAAPGADGNAVAVGDKVVHLKNQDMSVMTLAAFKNDPEDFRVDNTRRIFNGFVGLVKKIDADLGYVWVYYPSDHVVVIYEYGEVGSLVQLGYALTVHKAQGSEYSHVVLPIDVCYYNMLNTRLLYTAITRAKNHCTVIGNSQAIQIATSNLDSSNRNTVLQIFLEE